MNKLFIASTALTAVVGAGLIVVHFTLPGLLSVLLSPEGSPKGAKPGEANIDPKDYFVYQTVPLTRAKDGFDGKLEVLLDKKLEGGKDIRRMAGEVGGEDIDDPNNGKWKIAVVRLVDAGQVTKSLKTLFDSVASIQGRIDLYGDGRPVFRIDNWYQTDTNGSTYTDLIEIRGGKLAEIPAGLSEDYNPHLRMVDKWELTPSRSGKGMEILTLSLIQPDNEKEEVDVTYSRCSFNGHDWVSKNKEVTIGGTYESVGDRKLTEAEFPN